ncbi:MamJ protein [Magnetospirillum gryphiswaldense MSR-1 v2]|uniref:Magnetosome-associated protein MamJ n=1 Tax=Magnetospirillum gryphiswaldense (strain DSM 6361 / JCM 21280 / NBRC 15271 / MSR-1) TaxID=431944 RepID=MAMJ_MAGGM|nr:magnetosome protein MamJ [Magnetospirillum gryphiswaldense]V6F519.1 RecName: Full=Magnetosome-associated protein MamJ [Magnetospirillum gryphiswaldense MSR-1]CAE12033.1 mamJ [Magnetospirillum gryphiswaldense]CDK99593.1 MamJ protein [Magnetospirillum gryphiswaldense MSR-1 v2]
MAKNRRDRGTDLPGDGDQKISTGPEIVSVTVHPSPNLAAAAKPVQGDIWASLLESSPWSANQGGLVETAQPPSAPIRSQDPVPVADLVNRWSQPIWRTAPLAGNAESSEEGVVAPSLTQSDSVLAVSDLVIDVQPETDAEVEVSIEPEPALVEPVIEIEAEAAEVEPEPAPVADLVNRWAQPIWRTAPLAGNAESSEEGVVAPSLTQSDSVLAVSDLVIDVQPEANAEVEVSIEPEPALVEPVIEIEAEAAEVEPEPAPVEPVIEIEAEAAEVEPEPAPVEPVIEIEAEAAEVEPEPAPVEPAIEIEAIRVELEPVLIDEVVELVTEFEYSQAESVASADLIANPAPAESSRLAELLDEAAAIAAPAVAVAVEATRQPNKITASVKKRAPVQEVPVEDLLGGIFGVAGSAVRGVFTIGGGFVDGVVKGGRLVGSNVVAGTRRLAQTIEVSCGSCSSPKCDAEDKNK